jgi:type IV secretory pathway component VirB8
LNKAILKMEQKLEEIKNMDQEEVDEYFQFIKSSVADNSYFKDALDWYFFRYVTPICDRSLLIFGAVIAAVVLFFLTQMIKSAFPLVQEAPIFIRSLDQSLYFPNLVKLKPKKGEFGYDPEITTVDEAVAKYLLSLYVKDREGYDFSKAEVEAVNNKFNHIRNLSADNEYRSFQLIMSKNNSDSPINYFGQNVVKSIKIDSVKFIRNEPQDFGSRARKYLSIKIPAEAEVRFSAITKTADDNNETLKEEKENYVVKIKFAFSGVKKDEQGTLNFTINSYKLYKVK